MKFIISLLCFFHTIQSFSQENYEFIGTHFISSYYRCSSEKLDDITYLAKVLKEAVEESGATLIEEISYKFHPQGGTVLMLLSESHASIHTYPEKQACFVDLFTCGSKCDYKKFHQSLQKSLESVYASEKVLLRQ